MTASEFNDIASAISACITSLGILAAGAWAIWHFILKRERFAKIQFDLDLNVVSREHDHLLVEIIAVVENKGYVRHWLRDFRFDLLYLPTGALIMDGSEKINHQPTFEPVFKKRYWIPANWESSFIDAGIVQRYTYLAKAPKDSSVLLVLAHFRYPDSESEFHTSQKVFAVTPSPAQFDEIGAQNRNAQAPTPSGSP